MFLLNYVNKKRKQISVYVSIFSSYSINVFYLVRILRILFLNLNNNPDVTRKPTINIPSTIPNPASCIFT